MATARAVDGVDAPRIFDIYYILKKLRRRIRRETNERGLLP